MSEPMKPMEIEQRSFEIITELLGDRVLDPENELVIKRVIHTTADFDYADNLTFSDHAVQKGIAALKSGCDIVTDTQMAKAGINKTILASLGGEVHCFMSDPDVAQEARSRGVTRAFVSMEKAAALEKPCIFAIGNAPTALLSLEQLMEEGKAAPRAHHRRAGGLCECGDEQGAHHRKGARAVHRRAWTQGRQQRGRGHLQRPALSDQAVKRWKNIS